MSFTMPKKSQLDLPPLKLPKESLGVRIARLRKERGYTQVELAEKMGLIQSLVSDYERGQLRPHAEMVVRFALALDISADELLGLKKAKSNGRAPSRKFLRRVQAIEQLPLRDQQAILRMIDAFLKE